MKQEKPKAYRSPLWAHLDELRKWRLAQETWEAIAAKLLARYGIKISFQAVQAFYQRATSGDRRRPLGFAATPSNLGTRRGVTSTSQDSESIYEEARKVIKKEQHSKPTIVRPSKPL